MRIMKKALALLLALAMILTMMLTMSVSNVFAAAAGQLIVNGVDITKQENYTVQCGGGTAVYDPETSTLTLTDAVLDTNYSMGKYDLNRMIDNSTGEELTIVLVGDNVVGQNADWSTGYRIHSDTKLTIKGEGTLTVYGGNACIYSDVDLVIDGAKITVHGEADYGIGSHAGNITLQNGADVTGDNCTVLRTNGDGEGDDDGDIIISNSKLTASAPSEFNAVYAARRLIIINDSEITASSDYPSICADNDIIITNSTVDAGADKSYAIYSPQNVTIENSEVSAEGYYGSLRGDTGVTVTNSTVDAVSEAGSGIYSPLNVTIKNSEVSAKCYYPSLWGSTGVSITNSTVDAVSSNYHAIFSTADVVIGNSVITASAPDGSDGILSRGDASSVSGSWIKTSGTDDELGEVSNSVVIKSNIGEVIGDAVLPSDVTVAEGVALSISGDSTLTVPEGVTLTNAGTITNAGTVKLDGTLVGNPLSNIGGGKVETAAPAPAPVISYNPMPYYRAEAIKALDSYLALENYDAAEQDAISVILSTAKAEINKATSKTAIDTIVAETKAELDKVQTSEQKAAQAEAEKSEQIKAGVQNTTIEIYTSSVKNSDGERYIKIYWEKSKGYKVDYYEVFRKTGKDGKYGDSAFFIKDTSKIKSWYKNTKSLKKGTRYYYKVRGVRVIDGEKYYTQWSNVIYRTAK